MEQPRNCLQESRISGPNICRKTRCYLHSRNYAFKADKFKFEELQLINQRRRHKLPSTWRSSNLHRQNSTLPKNNTQHPLQVIAATIKIGRDLTIVSIYNSRSHAISEKLLSSLFQHLPKPVILTGNFNSYHQIFGSPTNHNMGCRVLSFIDINQQNILNDGRHKNIGYLKIGN